MAGNLDSDWEHKVCGGKRRSFLISGGAGFIGSALAERLLNLGCDVRIVDDGSTGRPQLLDSAIGIHHEDISAFRESEWMEILKPGDVVFHLAARKLNTPGVSDKELMATNLDSTIALARAATRAGVAKIVFTSSLYVYDHEHLDKTNEALIPRPQTLYGVSKLAGEHSLRAILRSTEVEWICARLYFTYGPRQYPGSGYKSVIVKNFERIRDGLQPIVCGSGTQRLDYVYVDDVVLALLKMGDAGESGATYNVSSGKGLSVVELIEIMLKVSGRQDLKPLFADPDWTEGTNRVGDPSKLIRDLHWTPAVSAEAGLERTWLDICSDERV